MNGRLEWKGKGAFRDSSIYLFDHTFNHDSLWIIKSFFETPTSIINLHEPIRTLNDGDEGKHKKNLKNNSMKTSGCLTKTKTKKENKN